jgi:hypothetical protein
VIRITFQELFTANTFLQNDIWKDARHRLQVARCGGLDAGYFGADLERAAEALALLGCLSASK